MSKVCQICARGPRASKSRSHSNVASNRRQQINLQIATIKGKKMRVCVRCLKTTRAK